MSLVPFGFKEFDQGLIQDLSEVGARIISEQKHLDLGTKRRVDGEIFFLTFLFCTRFSFD